MKVDIRLTHPGWVSIHGEDKDMGKNSHTYANFSTNGSETLYVLSDYPLPTHFDNFSLAKQPGRFSAVKISGDTVTMVTDRARSWPLLWTASRGASGTLVISDSATVMRSALDHEELYRDAVHEFLNCGYVTGTDTLYEGVHQTLQGTTTTIYALSKADTLAAADMQNTRSNFLSAQKYPLDRVHDTATCPHTIVVSNWGMMLHEGEEISDPQEFSDAFESSLDVAMERLMERVGSRRLILPLSGGLDSRLLLAWCARRGVTGQVLTFTYGNPDSREARISREVAATVGAKWTFVPYEKHALLSAWHSPETARYLDYSYNLSALPHVQDWYALVYMRTHGITKAEDSPSDTADARLTRRSFGADPLVGSIGNGESDVVIPGHTVVGNMHDEQLLDGPAPRVSQIAQTIIRHHYTLQGKHSSCMSNPYIAAKLHEFLHSIHHIRDPYQFTRSAITGFNARERQAKYINNSMRAYEFVGLDWALPMIEPEISAVWHSGSSVLTSTRNWYSDFVARIWAKATGQAYSAAPPLYTATSVSSENRSRMKSALTRLHLLGAAERSFSTWSALHSDLMFDALITHEPRVFAAYHLAEGRTTIGLWADAFLNDMWCRESRLFQGATTAEPSHF